MTLNRLLKAHEDQQNASQPENQAKSSSSQASSSPAEGSREANSSEGAATNSTLDELATVLHKIERHMNVVATNAIDHDAHTNDSLARIERDLARVVAIATRVEALVGRLQQVALSVTDDQLRATLAGAFGIEVREIAPVAPAEPPT